MSINFLENYTKGKITESRVRYSLTDTSSAAVQNLNNYKLAVVEFQNNAEVNGGVSIYGLHGNFYSWCHKQRNSSGSDVPGTEFLPWHRMYVYLYETALRYFTSYKSVTVPYWDYVAAQNGTLPDPFKNNGLPGAVLVDRDGTTAPSTRTPLALDENSFQGSLRAYDRTKETSDFFTYSNGTEGDPHGAVHVLLNGTMTSVSTAAYDPIFFSHHAEIDKIWNDWNDSKSFSYTKSEYFQKGQIFYNQGDTQETVPQTLNLSYFDENDPKMAFWECIGETSDRGDSWSESNKGYHIFGSHIRYQEPTTKSKKSKSNIHLLSSISSQISLRKTKPIRPYFLNIRHTHVVDSYIIRIYAGWNAFKKDKKRHTSPTKNSGRRENIHYLGSVHVFGMGQCCNKLTCEGKKNVSQKYIQTRLNVTNRYTRLLEYLVCEWTGKSGSIDKMKNEIILPLQFVIVKSEIIHKGNSKGKSGKKIKGSASCKSSVISIKEFNKSLIGKKTFEVTLSSKK